MSDFVGHGPDLGCAWTQCGGDKSTECPFMKNTYANTRQVPDCTHEYRQLLGNPAHGYPEIMEFYCIHCLTRRSVE